MQRTWPAFKRYCRMRCMRSWNVKRSRRCATATSTCHRWTSWKPSRRRRRLSFTRAADELALTQSAVSRQVAALEEFFGVPLFHRLHRALRLSEPGLLLQRAVRDVLQQLHQVSATLRHQVRPKTVVVTTTAGFAGLWLIPRLAGFTSTRPEVDVRISASNAVVNLNRDGVDLAVRYLTEDGAGTEALRLFGDSFVPVCSPQLLRDKTHPLKTPQDLRHHCLLHMDYGPGSELLEWPPWLGAMKVESLKPASVLHFSQYDQMIQAAVNGQGVALGRLPLVNSLLEQCKLVAPFNKQRAFAAQLLPAAVRHRPQQARGSGVPGLVACRGCDGRCRDRRSDHAARVQEALRIQRALDRAHHLQRHRRLVLRQLVAPSARRRRARRRSSRRMRRTASYTSVLTRSSCSRRKAWRRLARRRLHVVVQVAVAQVAEVHQPHAGNRRCQQRIGPRHERGDARHRHRDVVLDVQAFLGLRQRNALADVPELAAPARGSRPPPHRRRSRLPAPLPAGARTARGHVPRDSLSEFSSSTQSGRRPRQRHAQLRGKCRATSSSANRPITSKPVSPAPSCACASPSSATRSLQRGHGGPGGQRGGRQRVQLHGRGGDDAQRALAADEQVAQVVAGVVLAQARQAIPDLALRR